jgi:hypothetical protein
VFSMGRKHAWALCDPPSGEPICIGTSLTT